MKQKKQTRPTKAARDEGPLKEIEMARAKLRRRGCPPTRIPRFSGRTWVCEDPKYEIYTLGDGSKCCRETQSGKKPQARKEKGFQAKQALAPVIYKPDDPTKILNPWTGRWVKITGERGKQIIATFGLPLQ